MSASCTNHKLLAHPFDSCPVAASREPWVDGACRAWKWWDKSSLGSIEPHPSAALVEAVTLLEHESTLLRARQREDSAKDAAGAAKR